MGREGSGTCWDTGDLDREDDGEWCSSEEVIQGLEAKLGEPTASSLKCVFLNAPSVFKNC